MKIVRSLMPAVSLLAVGAFTIAPAHAQGGGFPGGGGGGMPPEMQKQFAAMQKFRDSHKQVMQIGQTMRAISEMDKDPRTQITRDQARKLLAIMRPWQSKPMMTNDQALAVNRSISGVLTLPQIKKMATLGRPGQGGGGFGGGRPGGGGGGFPGGGGGGRPGGGFRMPQLREYNPLNPASMPDSPWKQRSVDRMNQTINLLKQRAA